MRVREAAGVRVRVAKVETAGGRVLEPEGEAGTAVRLKEGGAVGEALLLDAEVREGGAVREALVLGGSDCEALGVRAGVLL